MIPEKVVVLAHSQKGFALLLVLLLLSLMVVLVFSVSYRGTLDAREFQFRYKMHQKQEILKSIVNVCHAWIKTNPTETNFKFHYNDNEIQIKVISQEKSFNINDLIGNISNISMSQFDEALSQSHLNPYKDSILDLVQQRNSPWVNISELFDSLSIKTTESLSFLSVHPNGSLIVEMEILFFDGQLQKEVIYYYPSAHGLSPVSQYALNESP